MRAVGVDGCREGWIAVVLEDGVFADAFFAEDFAAVVSRSGDAAAIGVDMPVGLPLQGKRQADEKARSFVGPRWASVFYTPPEAALKADSFRAAVNQCERVSTPRLSQQAWALRGKVHEVATVAAIDPRVFEVHPEVSFTELAGKPLERKRTWNGLRQRLGVLERERIVLPVLDDARAGSIPPDDPVDAAAAAWSAHRKAFCKAKSLPDPPERIGDRLVAIWY